MFIKQLSNFLVNYTGGVATRVEDFIDSQVRGHLVDDEQVLARAYLQTPVLDGLLRSWLSAVRARSYYAAASKHRLFLFEARLGALKPLLENRRTLITTFAALEVTKKRESLVLAFVARSAIEVRLETTSKQSSTQAQLFAKLLSIAKSELPRAHLKRE